MSILVRLAHLKNETFESGEHSVTSYIISIFGF